MLGIILLLLCILVFLYIILIIHGNSLLVNDKSLNENLSYIKRVLSSCTTSEMLDKTYLWGNDYLVRTEKVYSKRLWYIRFLVRNRFSYYRGDFNTIYNILSFVFKRDETIEL